MPYSTKKPSAGKSGKYGPLWSKLTRVMIAPAMRSITAKEGKRKKGGGRVHSRRKTFGNDEFIRTWTTPLRNIGRVPQQASDQKARASLRRRRSGRVRRHRGGFIRDGSVQHFPTGASAEEDLF